MSADKPNLICPCGKEVYPEIEYGVLVFKHKDTDNYCAYMNKFDTTVEGLTYKKIKTAMKECNHEEFIFLMNASDCSIDAFCKDLVKSDRNQIKKKLKLLLDIEESIEGISIMERHFKFVLKKIDNKFLDTSFIGNYKHIGSTLVLEVGKENMKNGAQKSVEGKYKMKTLSSFMDDLVNPFSIRADLENSLATLGRTIGTASAVTRTFGNSSSQASQRSEALKDAIKQISKLGPSF